ncbi:uncharacterized protein [Fopius arisanus]|uniref:Uncharacterized protein n=1 Tax=Fopius arisanus TaxID=64838 RepID=A0A9R1TJW2_9HYME|nr:PREDICTED: uncharacterized protein LOC105271035 [Fopius arisanus]
MTARVKSADLICWQKRAFERHRNRVKTAAPTVDMSPPCTRPHVLRDAKRLQLERERQAEIMRNNFILLRNLEDIMHGRRRKRSYRLDEKTAACIKTR